MVVHTPMIRLLTSARVKWLPRLGGEHRPEVVQRHVGRVQGGVEGVLEVAERGDDHPVEGREAPDHDQGDADVRAGSSSRRDVWLVRLVLGGLPTLGQWWWPCHFLFSPPPEPPDSTALTPRNLMKMNATRNTKRNVNVDRAAALLNAGSDLLHHQDRQGGGVVAVTRATAGHDRRQVVHAEHVERAEQQRHHQRRLDQRQRDRGEPLPGAGAVDLGRLVDLGRDQLETGEDQQRHERRRLPDVGDDDRRPGRPLVAEPHDVRVPSSAVRDAVVGEDEVPELRGHGGGDGPRDQHAGPDQAASRGSCRS